MRSAREGWVSGWLLAGLFGATTLVPMSQSVRAQVIEWVPVTASGNHTLNGNQIVLGGGGQTVRLHILLSGWDPGSTGIMLGSFQGTVDPAGYLGANASPPNPGVDLNPLGWPNTRGYGAFQAIDVCGNIDCLFDPTSPTCEWDESSNCPDDPCVEPIPWCFDRPDWVFVGGDWTEVVATTSALYAWSAASNTCAADPDGGVTKFYAGTLLLEVPLGTQGTYTIDFVDDPNFTLMTNCLGVVMTPITQVSAQISISCATDADCDDGNACTDDACEPDDTCSNTPNYDEAVSCCDPATGDLTPIDDGNECTTDACNPDGSVDHVLPPVWRVAGLPSASATPRIPAMHSGNASR